MAVQPCLCRTQSETMFGEKSKVIADVHVYCDKLNLQKGVAFCIYTKNKSADQLYIMIRAFVFQCVDSIISLNLKFQDTNYSLRLCRLLCV